MIRVLIVGTGTMARDHAQAYAAMSGATVVGAVDPNCANLQAFCTQFNIEESFPTIEDALGWGQFDAASIVTPDPVHARTTLPMLAAGKHVLCEKPLATNYADANEMAIAAQLAGVTNMVNLSYRNVPALAKAAEMVAAGDIGEVRHFEAAYLQSWLTQAAWGNWRTQDQWLWRLSTAHGSMGVLGDVGVHILDYATFAAGSDVARVSCRLHTFDKAPGGQIGPYALDANDSMAMHLSLKNGAMGVIHASRFASGHLNDLTLRLYGTKGGLDVRFEQGKSRLRACLEDQLQAQAWQDVDTPPVGTNYARFIDAIREGRQVQPDFHQGAILQQVLDLSLLSHGQMSQDQLVR
ncbi:Gfo/Idh/MocA family protein [Yoonia sediminilitoris]|uniref:Putative dehydrogenase n=1 Tax=Yoonia sediminilitoris TaxID=1286148 RepID=A0A2T6K9S2_9RHOB|nr:Gfo/Idh/MocA family oxidoreductase [Yoonia sediminilitoris]PUB11557.1 putative dehydrogenase [Yoonia sediminilitoris]RCW91757.1 putative dehydrogenase [Yoonia sediminilitoris]